MAKRLKLAVCDPTHFARLDADKEVHYELPMALEIEKYGAVNSRHVLLSFDGKQVIVSDAYNLINALHEVLK